MHGRERARGRARRSPAQAHLHGHGHWGNENRPQDKSLRAAFVRETLPSAGPGLRSEGSAGDTDRQLAASAIFSRVRIFWRSCRMAASWLAAIDCVS